jgi:hypothetical protein
MSDRLNAALDVDIAAEEDDMPTVDVRIARLILAAGLADRDIEALVDLEQETES